MAPIIEAVKSIYGRIMGVERKVASVERSQKHMDAKLKRLETENALLKQKVHEMDEIKTYLCGQNPKASFCGR